MNIADGIAEIPEVAAIAITTGRYDMLVLVTERTLDDLTQLVLGRIASIPGVLEDAGLAAPTERARRLAHTRQRSPA